MELWKPIPNYEGYYEVSSLGRIWSIARPWISPLRKLDRELKRKRKISKGPGVRGKFLKPWADKKGYLKVRLCGPAGSRNFGVSQIVARCFVPNNYVTKKFVIHLDGDPKNNAAANLQWATRKQMHRHISEIGRGPRGEANGRAKLTRDKVVSIRDRLQEGDKICRLTLEMGVDRRTIERIQRFEIWKGVI